MIVTSVFAPIVVVVYAAMAIPRVQVLGNFGGQDWIWLILLADMMLGLYYFVVVYLKEKSAADARFARMDSDHDGFIRAQDAGDRTELRRLFDQFDADGDGRMSRREFENFERATLSR